MPRAGAEWVGHDKYPCYAPPLKPCTRHNMMNPFCLVHFFKCNIPGAAPRHSPEYFLATVTLKSHGKKKHALWVSAVVVQCTPNNSLKPAALQLPHTYNSQHAGMLKRRRLEITALRMNMRRCLYGLATSTGPRPPKTQPGTGIVIRFVLTYFFILCHTLHKSPP